MAGLEPTGRIQRNPRFLPLYDPPRKDNAILRKTTKPAACKLPEISIHNGFPWNGGTDNNSRLIGIMYAGRDENDIRDDIVFYCMNDIGKH